MSVWYDIRREVGDAILADEVGIEYGICGDFRLWSAYQPIFAYENGCLVPVALESSSVPRLAGRAVPMAVFLDTVAAADHPFVARLCSALCLRNVRNTGMDGLDLFIEYDMPLADHARRSLAELRLITRRLGDIELEASMLVCSIAGQTVPESAAIADLACEMRRNGIRVALDDFGAGHLSEERLALIQPDVVRIGGGWFAEVCRHASAEKLFRQLVAVLHDRGAKVLVSGIEQPAQLRVALDGAVDLLQGSHLARPVLAGVRFDGEPLPVEMLLGKPAKVVPLFG